MALWLLIIAVLIIQEFATTGVVFLTAVQSHYPLWPIHLIWGTATLGDMYLGFSLGHHMRSRFANTRFAERLNTLIERARTRLGSHGERFSYTILAIFNFPYLNTFIGAWFGMSRRMAFLLTFIGNLCWYLLVWTTVLGTSAFIKNPDIIILIIVVIGVLSHFAFRATKKNF